MDTGDLAYEPLKAVLSQVAGGERLHYTRKSLSALSQKASGSFDRYLSDFETQSAYVIPSPIEKLELFQAGLLPGLRNRVLARPDGSEWTSWSEFLTVCRRFADAELRSRELPVKALEAVASAASTAAKGKRAADTSSAGQPSKRTAKKFKKLAASAAGTAVGDAKANHANQVKTQLISKWCREQRLCYNCLEPHHPKTDHRRNKDGKSECSRKRVFANNKWGKTLTDAVKEATASGSGSHS